MEALRTWDGWGVGGVGRCFHMRKSLEEQEKLHAQKLRSLLQTDEERQDHSSSYT